MINENHISKFLCLVLRHKPELLKLDMDQNGYVSVDKLLEGMSKKGMKITKTELIELVVNDTQERYSFGSIDQKYIRATYAHSVPIELGYNKTIPSSKLYYGISSKNISSVIENGLLKEHKNYVYVCRDIKTALSMGNKYKDIAIFEIDADEMFENDYEFYLVGSRVFLTDHVPPKYLTLIDKCDYKFITDSSPKETYTVEIRSSHFSNDDLYNLISDSEIIDELLHTGSLYGTIYSNANTAQEAIILDMRRCEIQTINIYREDGNIYGDVKVITPDLKLKAAIEALFDSGNIILVPVMIGNPSGFVKTNLFRFDYIRKECFRGVI